MVSTSQRQYRPSKQNRLTKTIGLEDLRARFAVSFAVLLLSCLLQTSVFARGSVTESASLGLATRTFKVVTIGPGCGGFFGHVRIDLESEGNEAGAGFTIGFDPTILSNPEVTVGANALSWALTLNESQVGIGRIFILLDSSTTAALSPPDRRMVNIRFDVAPGAPVGPTSITFVPNDASPAVVKAQSTSDSLGNLIPTAYQGADLMIGGTACTTSTRVSVSGRVTTSTGVGIRNAGVFITDSDGNQRKVLTSSLGYYQFDEIDSGKSYVIGVSSRRYRFASRVVQVIDNLTDLDFVGLE